MEEIKWIKLSTNMFDDEKIKKGVDVLVIKY